MNLEDDPTAEETVVASAVELDVEPMEEPLEVASAADEVMEETEAPAALGPGADEEMMEPSAVEAMEAELEAAFDAADAEMVDHSNGNNNEGIDDSLMLSELLGQHVNQDFLESSSLSPSPSTPSPPHSDIENSSPQTHGPAVEEPGQEVVAEEAGEAVCGGGGGGPRLHWTPPALVALEPHGQFKIRLNYNEHRLIGETIRVDSDAFIGVQRQKTYSRKFGGGRTWKEALHEVHKWLWEKWQIVESEFALARTVRQVKFQVLEPTACAGLERLAHRLSDCVAPSHVADRKMGTIWRRVKALGIQWQLYVRHQFPAIFFGFVHWLHPSLRATHDLMHGAHRLLGSCHSIWTALPNFDLHGSIW